MEINWTLISIFITTIVVGVLVHWYVFRRRLRAKFQEEVANQLNEELKRRVYEKLAQRLSQDIERPK